ncbi:lysophospholipid acyltransferase family protein [Nannocystaceae bacterium ST9]
MAERATLRDWARSIPASVGIMSSLLAFEPPLRVIGWSGNDARLMRMGYALASSLLRAFSMTGARVHVEGREHVVPGRRYVIVANHQGFSDVVVLSTVLDELTPRYVAKRELAYGWPSVSYMLRASGSAVIDRNQPGAAITEIERLGRDAKQHGWSVAIFPEGTRAKDGIPRNWKSRGIAALLRTTAPCEVLPISLTGGSELFSHSGLPFKAGVTLGVKIHAAVQPPDEIEGEAFEAWLDRTRETVADGVRALQAQVEGH